MTETQGVVQEMTDGFRTVFGRLGEFFHIFDLSFFVAGAVSFGALIFLYLRLGIVAKFPFPDWVGGIAIVIACYVCGLVSFAMGRLINGFLFRKNVLKSMLPQSLKVHDLNDGTIKHYLSKGKSELWRLYIRLWQELAHKHSRSIAFTHLSRYWAMAATFDGVGVSLLIWVVSILAATRIGTPLIGIIPAIACAILLLLGSVICFRQGGKYYEFQIEDLVAALAVARDAGHEAGET